MTETQRDAKKLIMALLEAVEPERMTGEEQRALTKLVAMVWRWERDE